MVSSLFVGPCLTFLSVYFSLYFMVFFFLSLFPFIILGKGIYKIFSQHSDMKDMILRLLTFANVIFTAHVN